MNFEWNPDTIRWYQAANQYSGFFKNIADLIKSDLEGYASFCDIGCGLGLIDLELFESISDVTCIDINPQVIAALQKNIKARNITNIRPLVMDSQDINENFDVIYISFFGARELEAFLPYCKKLFAVINKKHQAELYPEKYRKVNKTTAEEVERRLQQQGIRYSLREACFEFGQPLTSRDDAEKFVRTHAPDISQADLDLFLAERLTETGSKEYPFFISRMKSIGIFEVEGEL